ncbi:NAD-dependent epimerase/dehydratase family protein [Flavobacterium oreochromis]|uniref:NAD-dependent epimerase/dehydratase family protein n=1 Tax=Flavobacterium oreochromis TaxID=2906078 RepID=UPI0038587236
MLDIIITGVSGFVGQNLIEYFNKNKLQVIPLSLRSSFKIDYTADALIHLAGKTHDIKNTSS